MKKYIIILLAFIFLLGTTPIDAGYMKASFSYSKDGAWVHPDSIRASFLFNPPDSSAWLLLGSVKMVSTDTVPGSPGIPYLYVKTYSTTWTDSIGSIHIQYRAHVGADTIFADEKINGNSVLTYAQRDSLINRTRRILDSIYYTIIDVLAARDSAHLANVAAQAARDTGHNANVSALSARDSAHIANLAAIAARDSAHQAVLAALAGRDSTHNVRLFLDSLTWALGVDSGCKVISRYHNALDSLIYVNPAGAVTRTEVYYHVADTTSGGRPDTTKVY